MKSMNRGLIFILSATSKEADIKRISANLESFKWIYFGKDASAYCKIKKFIPIQGKGIDTGGLINKVAREQKGEFINFDKNISFGNSPHFWYATDVAEKNPYASDFFYNSCAAVVFQENVSKHPGNFIIFCEDLHLGFLLRRISLQDGREAKTLWRIGPIMFSYALLLAILHSFYSYACVIYQRLRFISLWAIRKAILMKYDVNAKNECLLSNGKSPDILLTLWADSNTFKDKEFLDKETYFGALPEHIRSSDKSIGYIAYPVYWTCKYEDIVKASVGINELVVFPEQCLNPWNVISSAILTLFDSAKLKKPIIISGIDVSSLFLTELRKEKSKRAQLERLQFYFIGQYLNSRRIVPKKVIHLYENQAWEKTLRLGIKKYSSQTELVGYQHTPFPALYINYFPSLKDINSFQVPDKIVTIGKKHRDIFIEHKYSAKGLVDGPALRFNYLFSDKHRGAKFANSGLLRPRIILVACSISYSEAFEIVCKTIEALRDHVKYDIYIKLHPKMNRGKCFVGDILGCLNLQQLPAHMRISNDPIAELLPKASVLFCNFTAAAYEAVALDVPVVFIQSDIWFDMDELEWFKESSFRAKGARQIIEILSEIENLSQMNIEKRNESSRKIITESFNEPSADLIKQFYC